MLRVRLHGTEEEIEKYISETNANKRLSVLSISKAHHDRGDSKLIRKYIDIDFLDEAASPRKYELDYIRVKLTQFVEEFMKEDRDVTRRVVSPTLFIVEKPKTDFKVMVSSQVEYDNFGNEVWYVSVLGTDNNKKDYPLQLDDEGLQK